MNLYGFVGNDPVGQWDYLGLWRQMKWSKRQWTPNPRSPGSIAEMFKVNAQHFWALQERFGLLTPVRYSPPAFRLLTHYLTGDGSEMPVDISEILRDEHGIRSQFIIDLIAGFQFAERLASSGHISSRFPGVTQTTKWHMALGRQSDYQGDAYVRVDGSCLTILFRYHIWDPWDFEYTNAPAGRFLTDYSLRRMHDLGLANEFLVSASTRVVTARWMRGGQRPNAVDLIDGL